MKRPFNMPDEFVQGFVKAGRDLWEALAASRPERDAPLRPSEEQAKANPPLARSLAALTDLQMTYCLQQFALWTNIAAIASGQRPAAPTIDPERGDHRFNAAEWRDNPAYSLLKQNYLLNSQFIRDMVEFVDLGDHEKRRLRFYARQFVELMSPTNFAAINPDVFKLALETGGESLKVGFEKLLADCSRGSLTITDEAAFEVGKNVAVSEGARRQRTHRRRHQPRVQEQAQLLGGWRRGRRRRKVARLRDRSSRQFVAPLDRLARADGARKGRRPQRARRP